MPKFEIGYTVKTRCTGTVFAETEEEAIDILVERVEDGIFLDDAYESSTDPEDDIDSLKVVPEG